MPSKLRQQDDNACCKFHCTVKFPSANAMPHLYLLCSGPQHASSTNARTWALRYLHNESLETRYSVSHTHWIHAHIVDFLPALQHLQTGRSSASLQRPPKMAAYSPELRLSNPEILKMDSPCNSQNGCRQPNSTYATPKNGESINSAFCKTTQSKQSRQ